MGGLYANDFGQEEIYVTAFPTGRGRWQVSQDGGAFNPVWRADGKELYYLSRDGFLHAAAVSPNGNEFQVDNSQALFPVRVDAWNPFDSSPDGQRFLFAVSPEVSSSPLTLVLNWQRQLKQ